MGVTRAGRGRRTGKLLAVAAAMAVLAGQGASAALAAPAPAPAKPALGSGPWAPPAAAGSKAAAALAARHHLGAAAKAASVPGHYARPVPVPDLVRPDQLGRPGPPPAWPAAGSATVSLPLQAGAQAAVRSSARRWRPAAGLPVQVA